MKIMTALLLIPALVFSVEKETDYKNAHLLVSADELYEYMQSNNLTIIDMRSEGYHEGHIPGAVWFGGPASLVDPDHAVEHHLVDAEVFQEMMQRIGLNEDSEAIIYDDGNGLHAARLFFSLELHGFENARILNGGMMAWQDKDFELSVEAEVPSPGNFEVAYKEGRTCDARFLKEAIQRDDVVILDVRSAEEFSGEREMAQRSGHIPNAVNLEWINFVEDEGIPFFRSAENIAELLAEAGITPDKEVVTHCHTNVRGSHAYFTLRLMGYDSVRAYEGSWSEWGNLEDAPINQ